MTDADLIHFSRPTHLVLELSALSHNLQQLKYLAPHSRVLAMVKANGYGHGLVEVAQALPEADGFGVAFLKEALCLTEAGITQPIFLMEGFFSPDELPIIFEHGYVLVLHHPKQIEDVRRFLETQSQRSAVASKAFSIWLKCETGMHRLGLTETELNDAISTLNALPGIQTPLHLMTHFAKADEPLSDATQKQYQRFKALVADLPGERSCANSAATLGCPNTHEDWVRPGIVLYGASPFADKTGDMHGLKPVMHLMSKLIGIKTVLKGEQVGYGGVWTAPRDSRIGVVAMGYGDGYPRHAPNGTPVWVGDRTVPLVGRVSMDMLTVDLTDFPDACLGMPVQLWGDKLPVEIVAQHAGTIPYELTCTITARVPRVYKP